MPADAFIQIRVTPETKERLRGLAAREQISESALVRQLIDVVLHTQVQESAPAKPPRACRNGRLSIRLEVDDQMLLAARASARGLRSATYVSLLVRGHLRNLAPIPANELRALRESVAELSAVGRYLRAIAGASQMGKPAALGKEEVRAMLKIAEGLRDHFKALLVANDKSWEQGHAETSD